MGAIKESWGVYLLYFVISAWAALRGFALMKIKSPSFLGTLTGLLGPVTGLGVFIPSFSFVVIGVFPSFSEPLRIRMKQNSRTSNQPLIRVMLDHFCLVLITSTILLLISLTFQTLIAIHLTMLSSSPWYFVTCLFSAFSIFLGLWFLLVTVTELLRSVRTMYIMVVADYS